MAKWRALEEYTPFARLLVEYMWEQRPPLLPNQFAEHMGVRKQAVSTWLNSDTAPPPPTLVRLARAMGLPVARLLVAAGYATAEDPLMDRADAWAYVTGEVERALGAAGAAGAGDGAEGVVPDEVRAATLALLRRLRTCEEDAIARVHAHDRTAGDGDPGAGPDHGPGDDAAQVADPAVVTVASEPA